MKEKLSRDGKEKGTQKLLAFEEAGNIRVLNNTTFKTNCTYIGYGTEKKRSIITFFQIMRILFLQIGIQHFLRIWNQ